MRQFWWNLVRRFLDGLLGGAGIGPGRTECSFWAALANELASLGLPDQDRRPRRKGGGVPISIREQGGRDTQDERATFCSLGL